MGFVTGLVDEQSVAGAFGADRELLVSWGVFNKVVLAEARTHFHNIRLWDSQDVLEVLLGAYKRLPAALKAEDPLNKIWTMVLGE